MIDGWQLLLDVVLSLTAALLLGIVFEKLRQSAIVGYLIAGILVGPGIMGWIQTGQTLLVIAEIGIVLLLFTLGLEFSGSQFRALGGRVFLGGVLQVVVTMAVVAGIGSAFGLGVPAALTIGACVALSSTAVVLRILQDRAEVDSLHGRASIGVLLVQDIAVMVLVLMVGAFGRGASGSPFFELGSALAKATGLLAAMLLLINLILPRLIDSGGFARNREMPAILAMTICCAATWSAHSIGLSPALGAFMAGVLLAESKFAGQIRADVLPFRAVFLTLFFASVGMLADVRWVLANWMLVGGFVATVLALKVTLTFVVLKPLLPTSVAALTASLALSQVGEFSFVLAKLGQTGGVIGDDVFQLIVAATIVTLLLSPPLVAGAPRLGRGIARRLFPRRWLGSSSLKHGNEIAARGRYLVVGYGDTGQATAHRLHEAGLPVLVLDFDGRAIRRAREAGLAAEVADATQAENLLHAGLEDAAAVIVSIPHDAASRLMIDQVKTLAPHIPVIARSRYHTFAEELRAAAADAVVDEELETGYALARTAIALGRPCPPVD